jgi:hypothetical protein
MHAKHVSKVLKTKRGLIYIALAAVVAVIAIYAALNWIGGGSGGGGGGSGGGGGGSGGGGNSTGGPPPGYTLYPTSGIVNGYNVIFLEDHVNEVDGRYVVSVGLVSTFSSLVAYGGSSVAGNITFGSAYIVHGYYRIPVVAFASTNSTITQDFPGMRVRLTADGGCVIYTPVSMAVYYRRHTFNIGSDVVYVWVPARSLPSTLCTGATQHVYIDPETAFYYVNGAPYRLTTDAPPTTVPRGVLRSWVIYSNRYGVYVFQVNP